jgi:membrane protease YdiL (CAAX protease family)
MPEIALPPPAGRGWLRPELLRPWGELVVIAACVLGLPIANSTRGAFQGASHDFMQLLASDRQLIRTSAWEAGLLAAFFLYLAWRGWKPADLRIGAGLVTSLEGIGLWLTGDLLVILALFTTIVIGFALQTAYPTLGSFFVAIAPHIPPHSLHVSWAAILVAMTLNAFFEEITCMGFIFTQLAERLGPVVALAVTVFLRAACHTYQDPFHLAGIVVLFTLYGLVYWWTRKLWPLIFAHLLLDIVSISMLKLMRD